MATRKPTGTTRPTRPDTVADHNGASAEVPPPDLTEGRATTGPFLSGGRVWLADPTAPEWRKLDPRPLPEWVTGFRDHQIDAVEEILEAFNAGAQIVTLDAPTGTGKTLIAEMVRRATARRAIYTCHSLGLQDQMVRDYPYARVLKGRANYPTQTAPYPNITCADCTRTGTDTPCMWCPDPEACGYRTARAQALASPLVTTNTSYLLHETLSPQSGLRGRDLTIIDETDTLETTLTGVIEYTITPGMARQLQVTIPPKGTHLTTIAKWLTETLDTAIIKHRARINGTGIDALRARRRYTQLLAETRRVAAELATPDTPGTPNTPSTKWVRDNRDGLTLKPVTPAPWGEERIWQHSPRHLLMSGTIISAEQLAVDLGIPDDTQRVDITVPMTFPLANRPIHAIPIANMTHRERDTAWPNMVNGIRAVANRHPNVKILVHTVSYQLAQHLHDQLTDLPRPTYTYQTAADRDPTVETYRASHNGILFAASVDRGFDFPHDDTRVVIVAKIPYPNLGDPITAQRTHSAGGQTWFNTQTVRSLVQMTGRAVRSADDWAETYILDAQFYRKLLKPPARQLLPRWWVDALNTTTTPRDLLGQA